VEDPLARSADVHEPSSQHTSSGTPLVSHSLPTSAQLSWIPVPKDKQNDTITGYTDQVEGPDSTREIPVVDGTVTSYEASDLRPYTAYIFSVSAMTLPSSSEYDARHPSWDAHSAAPRANLVESESFLFGQLVYVFPVFCT
jgi:hypothetical protein